MNVPEKKRLADWDQESRLLTGKAWNRPPAAAPYYTAYSPCLWQQLGHSTLGDRRALASAG